MECDYTSFVEINLLAGELWHFQYFQTWRLSAIMNFNFVILDHPRSQLCGSTTLSKFGIDPIFAVEYIEILWLCQFGWKMPFGSFWTFEPLKIAGRHKNRQKAHPRVTTRHLCHKRLKSVQRCDLGAVARKSITRTGQDNKKWQKRNISHIWG